MYKIYIYTHIYICEKYASFPSYSFMKFSRSEVVRLVTEKSNTSKYFSDVFLSFE